MSFFYPEPGDVRLVGGPSRCGGMLEIKRKGEWKPVDRRDWSLRLAVAVCGLLDCGSAVSTRGRTEPSHRHIWGIKSDCDAASLMKCFTRLVYSSTILEVTCSGNTINDVYYLSHICQLFTLYCHEHYCYFMSQLSAWLTLATLADLLEEYALCNVLTII